MKRAIRLFKHSKALSEFDKRLGRGLDSLLNFYKIQTDAQVLRDLEELKKPRDYPLEAAAEKCRRTRGSTVARRRLRSPRCRQMNRC